MFEQSVTSIPSLLASINGWFTPTVLFLILNLMILAITVTSIFATQKPTQNQNQNQNPLDNHPPHSAHQLATSPSVLQRLKSINFYSYKSPEPTTLSCGKPHQLHSHSTLLQSPQEAYHQNQPFISRSPSMLQRLKSVNLYNYFSQEPICSSLPCNQETHNTHFTPHPHYQQEQEEGVETKEKGTDTVQDQEEIYSSNEVIKSKSDAKPTSGEVLTKLAKKMKKSASSNTGFAHLEEEEEEDKAEARRPATMREGKSKATELDDAEVDARADDFINRFKQQLKLQSIDSIVRGREMSGRGIGNFTN